MSDAMEVIIGRHSLAINSSHNLAGRGKFRAHVCTDWTSASKHRD